jgi:hypothetical protein
MRLNRLTSRLTTISILVLFVIAVRPQQPVALDSSQPHGMPEEILQQHHIALRQRAVMAALRSDNAEVRVAAAELAAQNWPKNAAPAIEDAMLKEGSVWNRIRMAAALARLGDRRGRETLITECHNDSEWASVRMYAATVLSREFSDDSCLNPVLDVLQSESDPKEGMGAKEMALELVPDLIGRVDKRQSQKLFELLTSALRDPHPYLRMTASATLRSMGDVRAIPSLQAAIANETDEGCLRWMNVSLKELQSKRQTQ